MGSFRFRHLRLLVGDDGELEAVEVVGRSVESVDRVLADERNLIEKKFHYFFHKRLWIAVAPQWYNTRLVNKR